MSSPQFRSGGYRGLRRPDLTSICSCDKPIVFRTNYFGRTQWQHSGTASVFCYNTGEHQYLRAAPAEDASA